MSGVSVGGQAPDVVLAAEGGEQFLARVRELASIKSSADAAVQEMNLGRAAQAAMDDANSKREQALHDLEAAQKQAAKIVGDATAKSAGIISAAEDQRAAILKTAQEQAKTSLSQVTSEIMATKTEVEVWAQKTRDECKQMSAEAKANFDAAAVERTESKRLMVEAERANAQAKAANDAAQVARKKIESQADRMRAVLAEAGQ